MIAAADKAQTLANSRQWRGRQHHDLGLAV